MFSLARRALVNSLVEEEVRLRGKVDADQLHEHGCTFDTTGLPHHLSTAAEIDVYVADMVELLNRLKIKPKIITMARYAHRSTDVLLMYLVFERGII